MSLWRRIVGRFKRGREDENADGGAAADDGQTAADASADSDATAPSDAAYAGRSLADGEIGTSPDVALDDAAFGLSATPDLLGDDLEAAGDDELAGIGQNDDAGDGGERRLLGSGDSAALVVGSRGGGGGDGDSDERGLGRGLRALVRRHTRSADMGASGAAESARAQAAVRQAADEALAELSGELRELVEKLARERRDEHAIGGWLVDAHSKREVADILALVERLGQRGGRGRALELLDRASQVLPLHAALRLELAERFYERQRFADATELLDELALPAAHPLWRHPISVRAHFLLGDYYRREADPRRALQRYEAVLARDFLYPRARARAEDLRAKLDRPVGSAAPTILGADQVDESGNYVIERELGRGGGGTVYLARDRSVDRPVALKVLHAHVASQAEARAHLFCEARIAASLHHPRIVTIFDLDEDKNLVVMEYCAAGTLASRIAAGPLPLDQTLDALAQVSGVLDAVHRCGVVHRDLKPANLLRRPPPTGGGNAQLVLTDFGIAHVARADDANAAAGTRAYAAPEMRRDARADARADLYALGVILVEMLLGRRPLDDRQALAGALVYELDEVWRELDEVIAAPGIIDLARRLLHPDPDERPQAAHDVRAEALQLREQERVACARSAVYAELVARAGDNPDAETRAWLEASKRNVL